VEREREREGEKWGEGGGRDLSGILNGIGKPSETDTFSPQRE
jgi:hypothetical protein